ncbi:MAG: histone deacetylase [Phycisphaerales bacterium]
MDAAVLLISDAAMLDHDVGSGHPECPQRLEAVSGALRGCDLPGTTWASPTPCRARLLERVHDPGYVDRLDLLRGKTARLDADTAVSPGSVVAARLAASAAIDAVTAVVTGTARRAFALVRPPGHHAESDHAMGFCLFNNIAIAAAHARAELGCDRVLIVDWDVHHGNGTQHAFIDRPDILFFSTHQSPLWPGTGDVHEIGTDAGIGFTINVPLPAGCGDGAYRAVFDELLVPVADDFQPDVILVSAGFDADTRDPIGGMAVTTAGFGSLCGVVCDLADRHCQGRLALVLEGGYDLDALADGVRVCVEVMTGATPPEVLADPGHATQVIDEVRAMHRGFRPFPADEDH